MFDERNNIESDLMMRSILESGQEEVPAHIWDGISAELDKAAHRKTVVLWWRRAAIGAAAAAAVAAGVLLYDGQPEFTPSSMNNELIAVVEPERTIEEHIPQSTEPQSIQEQIATIDTYRLTAYVPEEIVTVGEAEATKEAEEPEAIQPEAAEAEAGQSEAAEVPRVTERNDYGTIDWGEEEDRYKVKSSLVLSGVTGSNNAQLIKNPNRFKAPTLTPGPAKTGVSESSGTPTYGIPLSFGAGVKVDLSPRWSLGIGANYSLLSRKFFGTYTEVSDEGTVQNSTSSDIRNTQHYVGIPVNAYYSIVDNRNINFYAYAGGTVEKCIQDKYEVISTSIIHKEKVDGVQTSVNLGIGVEFLLGKHLGLYIDPSLRYHFDCGQPKSIRTAQPLMMGFEMGLRVNL